MNIGIIVYSKTGNTKSVALKLKEKLSASGHSVDMKQIETSGGTDSNLKITNLKAISKIEQYDALVFGSPVQGFSLAEVMKNYLTQIASLKNKKVALLVTQMFPFQWMGGNNTIRQMTGICESKGGEISGSAIINWSNPNREEKIKNSVDRLTGLF